jgi:hypothetical protein
MPENSFFVVLPSNASSKVFPNNSMSDYTTKLSQTIDLANYEVALTEIQYDNRWHNVDVETTMYIKKFNGIRGTITIPPGVYTSVEEIVDYIHTSFDEMRIADTFTIEYDSKSRKVTFKMYDTYDMFTLTDRLAAHLGFVEKKQFTKVDLDSDTYTSDSYTDIERGMTALFVYTNIIKPQIVGDVSVPLLRAVPIKEKQSHALRAEEFRHPMYFPTIHEVTDLIQILIKRDNGEAVPFKSGKVIATLHFRKRS